jgi:hypothetical protein
VRANSHVIFVHQVWEISPHSAVSECSKEANFGKIFDRALDRTERGSRRRGPEDPRRRSAPDACFEISLEVDDRVNAEVK